MKSDLGNHQVLIILLLDTLSISGSDSDDGSEREDIETSTSVLKKESDESVKFHDDRRPKFYFKNKNDEIVSVFKKVLCNKQVVLLMIVV